MKTTAKKVKKALEYNETNIPGGSCMSGNFSTKEEAKKTATFIAELKAKKPKNILQKIFS